MDNRESNESGSGLGLGICKKIVEKLGGEISIESQQGIGTTVTFMINVTNVRFQEKIDTQVELNDTALKLEFPVSHVMNSFPDEEIDEFDLNK